MPLNARQYDRKIWLEKAIKEIEDALLNGIKSGHSMTFNGRSIQRHTTDELEKLRRAYNAELCKLERIEAGTQTRTIRVIG
ncbi:hypothetical protein A3765_10510 [Oleiphilus sp. HI0130]|nr:hypothetical protein A3765_18855 [Oleiphilus sp. HI0130]KZZ75246.1 hypothetical protein A3765_10510 [Oleiphilus sp. HI0130]